MNTLNQPNPDPLLVKLSRDYEEQQRKRTAEYFARVMWAVEELKRNQKPDKKKAA